MLYSFRCVTTGHAPGSPSPALPFLRFAAAGLDRPPRGLERTELILTTDLPSLAKVVVLVLCHRSHHDGADRMDHVALSATEHKSIFPMEFRAGVFGDRLIWHKARPESPVPGESPLAILAFPTGHSWVT